MSEERAKYGAEDEVKQSDTEWILVFVPKLFEWFEWMFVVGAIVYLAKIHPSVTLNIARWLVTSALGLYFGAFFGNYFSKPFHNSRKSQLIGWLIGGCIGLGFGLFVASIVNVIAENGGVK